REGQARELNNIGSVHKAKGDLNRALKYYNKSLTIYEEMGMPKQIGIVKGNIERISRQMKK
ncbi:MAG: hypothetical protein AMJ89_03095, partial [candidate division Zixibacteria bacterium SM23_73]